MAEKGKDKEDDAVAAAPPTLKELCNALYSSCSLHDSEKLFFQEDLLGLNIIPKGDDELLTLTKCIEKLLAQKLFKTHSKNSQVCWKVTKREDAAKFKGLTTEDAIVYSYIESAGREGIWTRTIRNRSNLHQAVVNRCYKSLETKNLIKAIQSAKFPTRKIYILSHLQPSEDVTGGPYFTDGALDDEFVRHLALWTEEYVVSHSWYRPHRPSSKKAKKSRMSAEEAEALRSKELDAPHTEARRVFLPYPPGYTGYPTLGEITKAINESKLSSVVMKEVDMLQLMNVLCWDGRVTKVMKGKAYKAARPNHRDIESAGNGLTEAPCGRCPVFDLCEEGGPVNARTCTYFQQWLGH